MKWFAVLVACMATSFLLLVASFSFAQNNQSNQTNLDTFFSEEELVVLEQLVVTAEVHDLAVQRALNELRVNQAELETFNRVTNALTISGGADVEGDIYGQSSLGYDISISLDIIKLIDVDDNTNVLNVAVDSARRDCRTRVVNAFVTYKVATQNAEVATLDLEAAEVGLDVSTSLYKAGKATQSDLLNSQERMGQAAVKLLEANGQVVVSLEELAAVVGITPTETQA